MSVPPRPTLHRGPMASGSASPSMSSTPQANRPTARNSRPTPAPARQGSGVLPALDAGYTPLRAKSAAPTLNPIRPPRMNGQDHDQTPRAMSNQPSNSLSAPDRIRLPLGSTPARPPTQPIPSQRAGAPAASLALPQADSPFQSQPQSQSRGDAQRHISQSLNNLASRSNKHTQDLKELMGMKDQLREAMSSWEQLRLTVAAQAKRIEKLEEEVSDLRTRNTSSSNVDSVTHKAISRMVRAAVDFCYGLETKPPQPYPEDEEAWPRHAASDGQTGDKAMRWDFSEPYSHENNVRESGRVLNLIHHNRTVIPLSADMPLTAIPLYETHADVYRSSLARLFKQFVAQWRKQQSKEWTQNGGREQVMKEISELQKRGDVAGSQNRIAERRDYMAAMDALASKGGPAKGQKEKSLIRGRLTTMTAYLVARRPHTQYAGDEYDALDTVYCGVTLVPVKVDDDKWEMYWPDMESVYSQEFIDAWTTIYNHKLPGSRSTGTVAKNPDDEHPAQPAEPYWPFFSSDLSKGPQRWMFNQEWLDAAALDPALTEKIDSWLVPADVPTSIADVEASTWFSDKNGLSGKGRSRSISTVPSSVKSPPEDNTNLPGSYTSNKRQRVRTQTPEEDPNRAPAETGDMSEPEHPPLRRYVSIEKEMSTARTPTSWIRPAAGTVPPSPLKQMHRNYQHQPGSAESNATTSSASTSSGRTAAHHPGITNAHNNLNWHLNHLPAPPSGVQNSQYEAMLGNGLSQAAARIMAGDTFDIPQLDDEDDPGTGLDIHNFLVDLDDTEVADPRAAQQTQQQWSMIEETYASPPEE